MEILSCMKSAIFLGTSGSDHHTGKQHYPGTSYEAIKSTCFVIMGTWNLIGAVASFLVCRHQAQAATWAPDEASSCKSEALIQLHPAMLQKFVPIWLLLAVEALCTTKAGCQHSSVQAVRLQDFTLHLALSTSPAWGFWWRLCLGTSLLVCSSQSSAVSSASQPGTSSRKPRQRTRTK